MNKVIRIALICTLVITATNASLAQRRTVKKTTTAPKILCEGDAIPKGFVIVGFKAAAKCGDKSQVIIRKPDEADIVCNGSPIPEGYRVANQMSSADCLRKGTNASANAVSIVSTVVVVRTGDDAIGRAFANGTSNIQVEGEGTVIRLLPDDLKGSRHQRFIVQLASEQTVLISHNIDVASRINELAVGDTVQFNGEYEWNDKGGVIHWTHRDPRGRHVGGWIKHNGKMFQ
jgi:hypothetical protein